MLYCSIIVKNKDCNSVCFSFYTIFSSNYYRKKISHSSFAKIIIFWRIPVFC